MPETMNEINATQTQQAIPPKVEVPAAGINEAPKVEEPKEDLVSRASKVKLEEKKVEPSNPFGLTKEDYDKVQADPTLSKFYKSMQSDYGRKTQEISELRKNYETKISDATKWTPEKIQQVLNDQNFVQAASQVLQSQAPKDFNGTQNDWSALSDSEKQRVLNLEKGYQQMSMQLAHEQMRKQDDTLKTKYSNYDPQAVDVITNELLQGKRNATREDLWKAVDYENAVKRAYELGRQDKQPEVLERQNASSMDGMQVNSPTRTEPPKKEESNSQALRRIFLDNLTKLKGRNQ